MMHGVIPARWHSLMQRIFFALLISTLLGWVVCASPAAAQESVPTETVPGPGPVTGPQPIPVDVQDISFLPTLDEGSIVPAKSPEQLASVLQTVGLLTFLTLAPSLLILMTCFTRIIIVFSFLRRALATQTLPPDQVLVGISLFLTFFIMAPTWEKAWTNGLDPYLEGRIDPATGQRMTQRELFTRMLEPQRDFMFACLEENDSEEEVVFFMGVSGHYREVDGETGYWVGENGRRVPTVDQLEYRDIPSVVLIPAFITSELKVGFWMGFLLYLPFLIVDVVIASVLMSMGMMMLPPVMISLPFKIILFVLVDGWRLLMEGIVTSFPVRVTSFFHMVT